jgi:NADH-quinone oxidoreductase subunit C
VIAPDELAERLHERFPDLVVARGEVTVAVAREELLDTVRWLRGEPALAFDAVADVSCTDWPGREPRVWMAYHMYSTRHGHRLRVKAGLPDGDLRIDSITPDFPAAEWQEREVFDFFGVTFDGHPDLRRIIMPEGWEGYPLRKDYPLGGVPTQYKGAFVPPPDERGL